MKKYLCVGAAALLMGASFTSCSKDKDLYDPAANAQAFLNSYAEAFYKVFGQPAADQTWGFGSNDASRLTRSRVTPAVATLTAPYDEAWVAKYLETAKEPDNENAVDNYNNVYYERCSFYADGNGKLGTLMNNPYPVYEGSVVTQDDKDWYDEHILPIFEEKGTRDWNNDPAYAALMLQVLAEYTGDYNYWGLVNVQMGGEKPDPTFVLNFKITDSWDGDINVVATEGYTDGVANGNQRTVVVTGTWNLTVNQRVGALGRIIVAKGGTINISADATLQAVNQAQLVVLDGGTIQGQGGVEFSNGTDGNLPSYNGGTINVGKFNNNFGDFYNYGTLKTTVMDGGAANSCYYNHGLVYVDHTGSSANMRVYNKCQWYVENNFRLKILENTSYVHVGGRLETIGSEDGTGQDAYIALANNSLIEAGSLHNTGTIWTGPTIGYAVASFGYIYQLDWAPGTESNALLSGYFENNIYVNIDTQTNQVGGSAGNRLCSDVFWSVVANGQGRGNGGVKQVKKGDSYVLLQADSDFQAGEKGCSPGFKTTDDPGNDPGNDPDPVYPDYRIIAEDLTVSEASDFDFNDVVFDVYYDADDNSKATIVLKAAGGTLPLKIRDAAGKEVEVHEAFGITDGSYPMINTGAGPNKSDVSFTVTINKNATAGDDGIHILVNKTKGDEDIDWIEMTAERGKAPAKIKVKHTYQWCSERQDIEKKYPLFPDYVQGNLTTGQSWY